MLSMQKNQEQRKNKNVKKQMVIRHKTVRLIYISLSKNVTANVESGGCSLSRSNANVLSTDQQRCR